MSFALSVAQYQQFEFGTCLTCNSFHLQPPTPAFCHWGNFTHSTQNYVISRCFALPLSKSDSYLCNLHEKEEVAQPAVTFSRIKFIVVVMEISCCLRSRVKIFFFFSVKEIVKMNSG